MLYVWRDGMLSVVGRPSNAKRTADDAWRGIPPKMPRGD
jgi:hypothetical protein